MHLVMGTEEELGLQPLKTTCRRIQGKETPLPQSIPLMLLTLEMATAVEVQGEVVEMPLQGGREVVDMEQMERMAATQTILTEEGEGERLGILP